MNPQPARPSTALPTRRARVHGPSVRLDPRINAYRGDLADIALADRVIASHYAAPALQRCITPVAAMRARPDHGATQISELLHGEEFAVLERRGGWAWGYSSHDRYVGYVPVETLGETAAPSHRIAAPQALVFAAPDIKSPLRATLPLGAAVAVIGREGRFAALESGFIHERHLGALAAAAGDPVDIATRFLGTPYLWGGRTRAGIDC